MTPHSGSEPWQDVRRVGFAARVDLDHALAQLFASAARGRHRACTPRLGARADDGHGCDRTGVHAVCPDRADRRLCHRRGRQLRRQRIQPDPAAARSDRGDCGRAHASRHRCGAALWSGRRVRDRRGVGAGRRRDAGAAVTHAPRKWSCPQASGSGRSPLRGPPRLGSRSSRCGVVREFPSRSPGRSRARPALDPVRAMRRRSDHQGRWVRLKRPGAADLALIAGRSGCGADDDAAPALAATGRMLLHGLAIAPGGSTGLGRSDGVPVVLLPGEPLACLVAYELVAGPAVRRIAGLATKLAARARATQPRRQDRLAHRDDRALAGRAAWRGGDAAGIARHGDPGHDRGGARVRPRSGRPGGLPAPAPRSRYTSSASAMANSD